MLNIRWQLLLAAIGTVLVVVMLSLGGEDESQEVEIPAQAETAAVSVATLNCTTLAPSHGGVISEGVVGAPQYINPLLSDANPIDQELVNLIFDGLIQYDNEGKQVPNLASGWSVSPDGLTVTFDLRQDVTWHDGEPFTAEDVAFTYQLLQSEDLSSIPRNSTLWRALEVSVLSDYQIAVKLPTLYSPFLDATTVGILPAHRFSGARAAEILESDFNVTPVGTGPFEVANNWREEGHLLLLPRSEQWSESVRLDALSLRFYANEAALFEAFEAQEIQAINRISLVGIPQASRLPNIQLFTAPAAYFTQLIFNLSSDNDSAVKIRSVRQALALGLQKEQLIEASLNGQALPFEGPYLPNSAAYNPNLPAPTSYNPISATAALDAAGWVSSGANGARQSGGESLTLRLLALDTAVNHALVNDLSDQWAELGVEITAAWENHPGYQEKLALRDFDMALVAVEPTQDPDLYDFWSQEAIIRGQNYGAWNNRRGSEALEAARQIWGVEDRLRNYKAFLQFYAQDVPAITLYQGLNTYGISREVSAVDIGRVSSPRLRYATLSQWFLGYQEVETACEPNE